jgi:hypothetical protein
MSKSKAGFNSAHGRAREFGRVAVNDQRPYDEMPSASPAETVRKDRGADGRFASGNSIARHSRVRTGPQGALVGLDAQAAPAWRAARQWARKGARHRIAELAQLHGGELGSEACALVVDSWELRGDARYLAAQARATGNAELARTAANLLSNARQAQRDAWAIAALEAEARKTKGTATRFLRSESKP